MFSRMTILSRLARGNAVTKLTPRRMVCVLAVGCAALTGATLVALAATRSPRPSAKAGLAFRISGDVTGLLRPGAVMRVGLAVSNPHRFPIVVKRVRGTLSIDKAHARAGCDLRKNFSYRQNLRRWKPLRLRPLATVRFTGRRAVMAPKVKMLDLKTTDQNACKGARLKIRYTGTAVKVRPRTVGAPRPAGSR